MRSLPINLLRLILVFLLFLTILPLGAQEKLTVDGDLTVKSADNGTVRYGLVVKPQNATPSSPQEGQLYYNATGDEFYYRDDTIVWKRLVGTDKYVATRIVAASDSLGTTCADGVCSNPRADYTCNGTADQNTIQSAIDALGANPGAVYLLEGTYNITDSIRLNTTALNDSGKALIGTGRGTVLKVVADASFRVIYAYGVAGSPPTFLNGILISQLMIDGDTALRSGEDWGIEFSYVTNSKIEKVWVENIADTTAGGDHHAIKLIASSNNTITNCNLKNSPFGIMIQQGSANNTVTNNNVQGNISVGIYLWSSVSGNTNNIIANNNVQGNGGWGISIVGSDNNIISDNNVQSPASGGGINLSWTTDGGSSYSDSNTVTNNNIQGGAYGILLSTSGQNLISNNNVRDSNTYGIYLYISSSGNTVTGNIVYNALGLYGIQLHNNSNTNIISSNRIYKESGSSSDYGIRITNATPISNNNYLIGNLIDGAGYIGTGYDRRILDQGTNTKYTDKMKVTLERVVVAPADNSILDASTSPQGYIALNPSGAVMLDTTTPISAGKSVGDVLILEGNSTNTVKIPNGANTVLITNDPGPPPNKKLDADDVLTLLWNGSAWVEMGFSDN